MLGLLVVGEGGQVHKSTFDVSVSSADSLQLLQVRDSVLHTHALVNDETVLHILTGPAQTHLGAPARMCSLASVIATLQQRTRVQNQ